jgi:cytoskeletal protein CcmA (bactofilin family)
MISSSGIRRSLEDRIVLCADCDATRTLSLLISGNLVCSTCGSDNWMHVPMTANIKKTFLIKGEIRVEEDLSVDGRVEGRIDLGDHNLWVAPHGEVNAVIHAKNVIIAGALIGKITATEMVEIKLSGSVEATIKCPRVVIADGAKFNGSIETAAASDTAPMPGFQEADSAKMSYSASSGLFPSLKSTWNNTL